MRNILDDQEIEKIISEATHLSEAEYKQPEPTARQHAKLQSLNIKINAELIKTIRHLDDKNGKLQKLVLWLSVIATVATIVALFK